MGYTMQNGRHANTEDVILAPSAARNAAFEGGALELGDRQTLRLLLNVTAASGTSPTLDVTVKTRRDASDAWRTVAAFAQATGVGSERKCFSGLDREVKVDAAIGGTNTPSFTWSVTGEAA